MSLNNFNEYKLVDFLNSQKFRFQLKIFTFFLIIVIASIFLSVSSINYFNLPNKKELAEIDGKTDGVQSFKNYLHIDVAGIIYVLDKDVVQRAFVSKLENFSKNENLKIKFNSNEISFSKFTILALSSPDEVYLDLSNGYDSYVGKLKFKIFAALVFLILGILLTLKSIFFYLKRND